VLFWALKSERTDIVELIVKLVEIVEAIAGFPFSSIKSVLASPEWI
jgi:hypothetical protein